MLLSGCLKLFASLCLVYLPDRLRSMGVGNTTVDGRRQDEEESVCREVMEFGGQREERKCAGGEELDADGGLFSVHADKMEMSGRL